jgi:hypothetical protein
MRGWWITWILLLGSLTLARAGEVEIVMTVWQQHGDTWQITTTLRHADTGWSHYADAWRVVTASGDVLGERTLFHPHADEQPFSRDLSGVTISSAITVVYVEAHDNVHGWSAQRLRVDLTQAAGERFRVQR